MIAVRGEGVRAWIANRIGTVSVDDHRVFRERLAAISPSQPGMLLADAPILHA
jgi:hypothetical protein